MKTVMKQIEIDKLVLIIRDSNGWEGVPYEACSVADPPVDGAE